MAKRIKSGAGKEKKAFSILELITAIIIVATLATFGIVSFFKSKERALDKEAISILKLIQAAEQGYKFDTYDSGTSTYYPSSGLATDPATINQNLHLSLPTDPTKYNWGYAISSNGYSTATRSTYGGTPSSYYRTWVLGISDVSPTCSGSGCP